MTVLFCWASCLEVGYEPRVFTIADLLLLLASRLAGFDGSFKNALRLTAPIFCGLARRKGLRLVDQRSLSSQNRRPSLKTMGATPNTIKYHQIPSATLIGSGLGFWWIIYDKASLALSIFLLWTFGFSACGHLLLGICARGRSLAKDLEDPIHQSHVDLCRSGARPDPSHHQPPSATISHPCSLSIPIHPYVFHGPPVKPCDFQCQIHLRSMRSVVPSIWH